MNCDGVSGLLSAYVDGELTAGELLRVEQHLRRCHWCADEVDALRQTISLVASLQEVAIPAAFHIQLHERLVALGPPVAPVRTVSAQRAKRQDFRRWAAPAAAAAALVIGVAGLNRIAPPLAQEPPAAIGPQNPSSSEKGGGDVAANAENPVVQPPVGSNQQPNSSGAGGTNPVPPAGTGSEQPVVTQPPSNHTDPNPPPAVTPGPTTTRNWAGAASVSFFDKLSVPADLPTQKELIASLEAKAADPAAMAANLVNQFGGAISQNVDPASGKIQLQITVDAKEYATALAFVEAQVGVKAVDLSRDLTSQLALAYDELAPLEQQRLDMIGQESTMTDADADRAFAQLEAQAAEYRTAYQLLQEKVAKATITVTLQPVKAQ